MVKCRYCGVKIPKEEAYVDEDFNDDFEIVRKYYCSKKHYEYKERRTEMMENIYNNFAEIIGVKVKANIYFAKMFKDIKDNYRVDVIDKYLEDNKYKLENILHQKCYATLNAEIKYLMTIVQRELHEYDVVQKERSRVETYVTHETSEDFVDFTKVKKKDKGKSLDELLDDLE